MKTMSMCGSTCRYNIYVSVCVYVCAVMFILQHQQFFCLLTDIIWVQTYTALFL